MDMNIYKITNKKTEQSYIVVTPMSWLSYYEYRLDDSKTWSSKFLDMIRRTKERDLEVTCLETDISVDEAWYLQIRYIKQFNTYDKGYQSNTGGMKWDEGWEKRVK